METPALFKRSPPKLLYPALIVAAICVTLFSLIGIATMTGHLPGAMAGVDEKSPATQSAAKLAAAPCVDCGVIESVRAVEVKGTPVLARSSAAWLAPWWAITWAGGTAARR